MVREERDLQSQFSIKERTEKLLANLESLNQEGKVSPEQFATMKRGYDTTLLETQRKIVVVKQSLTAQLTQEQRNLDIFTQEQKNNEIRFQVGELKAEEFAKATQRINGKTDKIKARITELERLVAVTSSAEVGGYLETAHAEGKGTVRMPGLGSRIKLLSVVGIVAIAGIAYLLFFSGLFVGQPEDVAVQFMRHMDNGEYDQMLNLAVNPSTLQPYTAEQKAPILAVLKATYGEHGENLQISDIKILNKQRITDDKYEITVSAKYTTSLYGSSTSNTRTETITIVKVNGSWKVATRIPGFEAVLGLLALLVVAVGTRRRI